MTIILVVSGVIAFIILLPLVMAASAQWDLKRVQRKHGLTNAEAEEYAHELVTTAQILATAGIGSRPDGGMTRGEVRRQARQFTLEAILEKREERGSELGD